MNIFIIKMLFAIPAYQMRINLISLPLQANRSEQFAFGGGGSTIVLNQCDGYIFFVDVVSQNYERKNTLLVYLVVLVKPNERNK